MSITRLHTRSFPATLATVVAVPLALAACDGTMALGDSGASVDAAVPPGTDALVLAADAYVPPGLDAGPAPDAHVVAVTDAGPRPDAASDAALPDFPCVGEALAVIDAVNARLPEDMHIAFLGVPTGRDIDAERARRGPRLSSLRMIDEISTDGPNQIIRGVDADHIGDVHPGTIIIDSRIHDGWAVDQPDVIFAHVEITDPAAGNLLVSRDASDGLIVVNGWFHDSDADCFRPNDNEVYLGNFVERLGRGPDSHADGFQTFLGGRDETVDHVDVLGNIIYMPRGVPIEGGSGTYQTNRTVLFSADVTDWVVQCNFLVAGNYVVEREEADDIRYLDNVFCHPDDCESFGVRTGTGWNAENWSGNTYIDGSPAP